MPNYDILYNAQLAEVLTQISPLKVTTETLEKDPLCIQKQMTCLRGAMLHAHKLTMLKLLEEDNGNGK
jgi:hypothetical protein